LQRPPAVAGRINVEAKVAEAALPRDRQQPHIVGRNDIAEWDVKFVERPLQRSALRALDAALGDAAG
jgi:hypothetical protein